MLRRSTGILAFLIVSFLLARTAQAQRLTTPGPEQPLTIEVGAKASTHPQVNLFLQPAEYLVFQFSGYYKDVIRADHGAVSAAALLRFPLNEKASLQVGPSLTWYGSAFEDWYYNSDRWGHGVGPMVELDYQMSEQFRAFMDLSAAVGLEAQGVRMSGTGIGLAYQIHGK